MSPRESSSELQFFGLIMFSAKSGQVLGRQHCWSVIFSVCIRGRQKVIKEHLGQSLLVCALRDDVPIWAYPKCID